MDRPNLIPVTARAGTPKFVITQRFDAAAVRDRHAATMDDLVARLHGPSDGDRIPVVIDASSCAHAALEGGVKLQGADRERRESLDLVDVTTFARDTLLPRREKKDFAVAGARLKIGEKMPTSLPPDALDGLIRHPRSGVQQSSRYDLFAASDMRYGRWVSASHFRGPGAERYRWSG